MIAPMQFTARTIKIIGEQQRETALAAIRNLPILDPPVEVVMREEKKTRKLDQNAAYWAGSLKDIAEQAWIGGRLYQAEVIHEYFKREFLPEDDDLELDTLTKDGYRKWAILPSGERVLIGTTTQLTVKGFARYLQQVEAFGARLGVCFSASPNGNRLA